MNAETWPNFQYPIYRGKMGASPYFLELERVSAFAVFQWLRRDAAGLQPAQRKPVPRGVVADSVSAQRGTRTANENRRS